MKRRRILCIFSILLLFFSLHGESGFASPLPQAKVLLFYVDGLRPDTVDEMVAQKKLPNIGKFFYGKGARFRNCFTIFPSNTVIANGLFMTGKWPDRNGLKTQAFFERFATFPKGRLHFLRPKTRYPHQANLLADPDITPRILKANKVETLYTLLGDRYHSGAVPISPYPAPVAWPHVAVNTVPHPWDVPNEASQKIDEINGNYAVHYMATDHRGSIFLIWFPFLDEEQHRDPEGQFGKVRSQLEEVDRWIGRVYEAFVREDPETPLYLVLFSDHGAYGGKNGVYNQPFHIARDFFYENLKMNVKGPDFSLTYPGTKEKAFAYIDNMGRGQAKIYLPVGDIAAARWDRPNTFYELERYGRGPNRPPVNLIDALLGIHLEERNIFSSAGIGPHPVDFVFIKIREGLIFLKHNDGSMGLIWTKEDTGQKTFRYMPVSDFSQDIQGEIHFKESYAKDPLGYLQDPDLSVEGSREDFLAAYHTQQEWLDATFKTRFPDAVVSLARSFAWDKRLLLRARSQDPDLAISAAPGWNFRIENIPGADHGSLLADSMRATLMISGPGIKNGAIETPHRLVELTPTLFQWIGWKKKTEFDEKPLQDIYEK